MTTVVGYIRVSTEEQATGGHSLAAQEDKIRAYCALYDLDLCGLYRDAGLSAKSLDRDGLQDALSDLRAGGVRGLVVAKLDRLTRSVGDLDRLLRDYFREGARWPSSLYSVSDQVDTTSASGRLVLNVLMSVAQWEREAIGERTRDTLRSMKAAGKVYGRVPFGYCAEDGILQPDQEELEILARMQYLRGCGESLATIAKDITTRKGPTRASKPWTASSVRYVLGEDPRACRTSVGGKESS